MKNIEIVYNGKQLTLPKALLPENGQPFPHHFQSSPADNLIELAGRVCYDSAKLEKTRNTSDYHKHIIEVAHTSTQEHYNITVEFPTINKQINDFILWSCLNRPGVFVLGNPATGNVRVTANIRAIREWGSWHNNLLSPDEQMRVGTTLQYHARIVASLATSDLGSIDPSYGGTFIADPVAPQEQWLSFYIHDVSRGYSHEWVRHKWHTAISQRSTRYVDESDSPWIYHPLFEKYQDEILKIQLNCQEKAFQVNLINPYCLEPISKNLYDIIVNKLQELLIKDGIDKFTARKQSRATARGLLGNALATEMIWSGSVAAILNIIQQRAVPAADAEIRGVAVQLFDIVLSLYPSIFDKYHKIPSPDRIGDIVCLKNNISSNPKIV